MLRSFLNHPVYVCVLSSDVVGNSHCVAAYGMIINPYPANVENMVNS